MFPGSRSCINLVSRVVRPLTHIDDARAYIVPYIHRRFIPRHLAPTVGLVRVDSQLDGSNLHQQTTASSSPHRSSDSAASSSSSTRRPRGLDINIAPAYCWSTPSDSQAESACSTSVIYVIVYSTSHLRNYWGNKVTSSNIAEAGHAEPGSRNSIKLRPGLGFEGRSTCHCLARARADIQSDCNKEKEKEAVHESAQEVNCHTLRGSKIQFEKKRATSTSY